MLLLKMVFTTKLEEKKKEKEEKSKKEYPTSGFVIVKVHQTAPLFAGSSLVVLLTFADVDEALRESVS